MDLWDALVDMVIGGGFAIVGLSVFAKHRSILGTVLWLSFCIAFMASVLLALNGLVAAQWVDVYKYAVIGIGLILQSISALYLPPSPTFPNWINWAGLVLGAVAIFWAMVGGLRYYWR
ncbi:MAG TPA: hypothetical protein VMC85_04380 [Desulfomonilaceae bacterium]|nr:hypothetical protein [Desulfomonilaceae bacterium]